MSAEKGDTLFTSYNDTSKQFFYCKSSAADYWAYRLKISRRQRNSWTDNTKEWTFLPMPDLLTIASRREDWEKISAESFVTSPPPPTDDPTGQGTELNWNLWTRPTALPIIQYSKKMLNMVRNRTPNSKTYPSTLPYMQYSERIRDGCQNQGCHNPFKNTKG